ncbi:chemotaxis-specific protein-glutamate methyltransferase CheB [Salinirubellus salinus]
MTGQRSRGKGRLRAVVVDDSAFMRSLVVETLREADVEVVATAADGHEAVAAVADHDPDVVTMDVEMPRMDGVTATAQIVRETPTPVLLVSAHTTEGAEVTLEGLSKGAADFTPKPDPDRGGVGAFRRELTEKVPAVASVDATSLVPSETATPTPATRAPAQRSYVADPVLVVGASTGGPAVVERLFADLPRAADLRVLVVQHMPDGFTARFAERLDAAGPYDVSEAGDGDRIGGGEALVAPGGSHLAVRRNAGGRLRVALDDGPRVNNVRPAVDVTMASAARRVEDPLVGVVLTGMGGDGTDGLRAMKRAGARTLAQDEATAAVFGMPRRAIGAGVVDRVVPADGVAGAVAAAVTSGGGD